MTEQSDACVRQPPPCTLCTNLAVAHCRAGTMYVARYLSIKTTADWTIYNEKAVCGYCLCVIFRDAGKSVDLDQDMPNPRLTDKQSEELDNAKFDRLVTEHISRKCQREGNAWIWGQSVESVRLSTEIDILNNNVNISHDHSGNNSFGGRERGDVCMEF